MTKKDMQKRIEWTEEHIERAIAEAQADQQKYPASARLWEHEEAGLKQALFILRCYLRPDHPDVKKVDEERKQKILETG